MVHKMNLWDESFQKIKDKTKTIELRLLDEKRQRISIGDILIFQNSKNLTETISCLVKKLHIFDDFETLYAALPLDKCGYLPCEVSSASPKDMENYYSAEKLNRYQALGIEIELLGN